MAFEQLYQFASSFPLHHPAHLVQGPLVLGLDLLVPVLGLVPLVLGPAPVLVPAPARVAVLVRARVVVLAPAPDRDSERRRDRAELPDQESLNR